MNPIRVPVLAGLAAAAICAATAPAQGATWTFETVALTGQPVPVLPGVAWSGFDAPALNGAGDTAFSASLSGTVVTSANDTGIFSEKGGSLGLVARTGDAAPGAGAAVFSTLLGTPALNDAGDTAFLGFFTAAGVTGETGGIFAEDGGTLDLVARAGDVAPGTGGAAFSGFGAPALNGAADTAFFGGLTGPGVSVRSAAGIFAESGGALGLVAREDGLAPGTGGAVFLDLGSPALNDAGDTAFRSSLFGSGVTSSNDTGIFTEEGGTLGLVVREGGAAPGAGSALFSSFGSPALNDAGDTAFFGGLTGTGVNSANDGGIFAEDGGALRLVVRKGDAAPGTGVGPDGALFFDFGSPALNDAGDTAFLARLIGGDGLVEPNDRGLFAERGGTLGLVAREGDAIEVLMGDVRTIASIGWLTGGFNDAGQVAFRANFTDGSQAILLASLGEARVPLPASAWLLLGGLGLLGWRARGRSPTAAA